MFLHRVPVSDLSPPLTQALHILLSIPFLPRLLPIWALVPEPQEAPVLSAKPMLLELDKEIPLPRRHLGAVPSAVVEPTRQKPSMSSASTISHRGGHRVITVPPSRSDPTALSIRVLGVVEQFLQRNLPFPKKPDDEQSRTLLLDETLAPSLMLLARTAAGSAPIRAYLKETILPSTLCVYFHPSSLEVTVSQGPIRGSWTFRIAKGTTWRSAASHGMRQSLTSQRYSWRAAVGGM